MLSGCYGYEKLNAYVQAIDVQLRLLSIENSV